MSKRYVDDVLKDVFSSFVRTVETEDLSIALESTQSQDVEQHFFELITHLFARFVDTVDWKKVSEEIGDTQLKNIILEQFIQDKANEFKSNSLFMQGVSMESTLPKHFQAYVGGKLHDLIDTTDWRNVDKRLREICQLSASENPPKPTG